MDATTDVGPPAATPPVPAAAGPLPPDPIAQLVDELIALEDSMPPPDQAAIKADWRWVLEHEESGLFAPYGGQHVAVVDRQIRGAERDSLRLRIDVARRLGIHPARIVHFYVPDPTNEHEVAMWPFFGS
jgi:hypothetical protein